MVTVEKGSSMLPASGSSRTSMNCPRCWNDFVPDDDIGYYANCPFCKGIVELAESPLFQPPHIDQKNCSNCGAMIETWRKTCPTCGADTNY
ncbi:putative amidophosphoribosyltransferase [Nocardiopsis mwathae]|uniref:Putative amidophosphoribosyltransferase n=1 Tax=Nocardiopsis mwathae TaxID=1472723 RepID=A0A7W9YH05_9ACTN|nr:hypothetical protein [Nocardiopsis mwathae]MBB6171780.1 putative amidophosphoribosyltransferase [Nocardiopsis mwathae]